MSNKEHVTISIDTGLSKKILENGGNISLICNQALQDFLNKLNEDKLKKALGIEALKKSCKYEDWYDTISYDTFKTLISFGNTMPYMRRVVEARLIKDHANANLPLLIEYLTAKYNLQIEQERDLSKPTNVKARIVKEPTG